MPTTEAGLVWAITKAIRKNCPDCWVFKVHGSPYQMAGVPDLLLCVGGVLVGLEVKFQRPGESIAHAVGRTTPQQQEQIARINRSGGMAATVTTVAEALGLIDRAREKAQQ
jgi:hypothetical protein